MACALAVKLLQHVATAHKPQAAAEAERPYDSDCTAALPVLQNLGPPPAS